MCIQRPIIVSVILVLVIGAVAFVRLARADQLRAQSLNCASSVTSICFAGRMWAEDHDGRFPTNFICLSNEVPTPMLFSCLPARRVSDWSAFKPENCTYEIVVPGVPESATNTAFLRCTIHGHLGYPDMTVFDGVRRRGKQK